MSFWSNFIQKRDILLFGKYKDLYYRKISGSILEIGAGNGVNFHYYAAGSSITVIEPNISKYTLLQEKAKQYNLELVLHHNPQHINKIESNAFDNVVDSLVLCSVDSAKDTVNDIHRVLKNGGTYYFLEHIQAKTGTTKYLAQKYFKKIWYQLSRCDCHRASDIVIRNIFPNTKYEYFQLQSITFPLTNSYIIGSAKK